MKKIKLLYSIIFFNYLSWELLDFILNKKIKTKNNVLNETLMGKNNKKIITPFDYNSQETLNGKEIFIIDINSTNLLLYIPIKIFSIYLIDQFAQIFLIDLLKKLIPNTLCDTTKDDIDKLNFLEQECYTISDIYPDDTKKGKSRYFQKYNRLNTFIVRVTASLIVSLIGSYFIKKKKFFKKNLHYDNPVLFLFFNLNIDFFINLILLIIFIIWFFFIPYQLKIKKITKEQDINNHYKTKDWLIRIAIFLEMIYNTLIKVGFIISSIFFSPLLMGKNSFILDKNLINVLNSKEIENLMEENFITLKQFNQFQKRMDNKKIKLKEKVKTYKDYFNELLN